MAGSNERLGGYAAVAVAAFLMGRCSVAETPPPEPVAPQALFEAPEPPAQNGEVDREPVTAITTADAPSDNPSALADIPAESDEPAEQSVYYSRCAEARAAGAAPIHVGEPGYASHLDRDGDGVACE